MINRNTNNLILDLRQKAACVRFVFRKVLITYVIIALSLLSFSLGSRTYAYFGDEEIGSNSIGAGILDFTVAGDGIDEENFGNHDEASTILAVTDEGDIDFVYELSVESSGDLCQFLTFSAELSSEPGSGFINVPLENFSSGVSYETGGVWFIEVSLDETGAFGSCYFDFVFAGEQITIDGSDGYWDIETVENWIGTGEKTEEELAITSVDWYMTNPDEPNNTDVVIVWETNLPADSEVQYGTSTSYGSVATSSALVTDHALALTDLELGTYHFRVISESGLPQIVMTGDYTFELASAPMIETLAMEGIENLSGDTEGTAGGPDIVINEFLATGAIYPEFIEFYNRGDAAGNMEAWEIEIVDSTKSISLPISSTTIAAGDWAVKYFFDNDILGESGTISLLDAEGAVVDSYSYEGATTTDKSFARIPDGSDNWVDPIPTPGEANKLESTDEEINEEEIIEESVAEETSNEPAPVNDEEVASPTPEIEMETPSAGGSEEQEEQSVETQGEETEVISESSYAPEGATEDKDEAPIEKEEAVVETEDPPSPEATGGQGVPIEREDESPSAPEGATEDKPEPEPEPAVAPEPEPEPAPEPESVPALEPVSEIVIE